MKFIDTTPYDAGVAQIASAFHKKKSMKGFHMVRPVVSDCAKNITHCDSVPLSHCVTMEIVMSDCKAK